MACWSLGRRDRGHGQLQQSPVVPKHGFEAAEALDLPGPCSRSNG